TTTNFDETNFANLFTPFTGSGQLSLAEINADASGGELEDPQENVVFENTGSGDIDLTGYTVEDDTDGFNSYDFPSGFTLSAGDQVTLFSGTGTDTATELYWGKTGSAVWNNGGDTVFVFDDTNSTVIEETY
ncbi:nuclease, partial [Halobacteriales archaeon QH_10_65_19]